MRNLLVTTVLACAVTLLSGTSFACGESLFRVGKGVSYREYTAPLPGNILAIANTEAELRMVERLEAAGHKIHVVTNPDQLAEELEKQHYDILLAYYSQREEIIAQISQTSITYLPVANSDEEAVQAKAQYTRTLSNGDGVKKFLKTIHRTLRAT